MENEDLEERPASAADEAGETTPDSAEEAADRALLDANVAEALAESAFEDASRELAVADDLRDLAEAEAEAGEIEQATVDEAAAEEIEAAAAEDIADGLAAEAIAADRLAEATAASDESGTAETTAEAEAPESPAEAEAPEPVEVQVPEPAETEAAPVAEAEDVVRLDEADVADEAEEAEPASSIIRGPGEWYVVHTYSGYENKVKANLHQRIASMQMEDKIFDVVIPMEDVMEIKGGKKQVVQRKVFPGYLLVRMIYDNDSWYVVRNTPGVTGFVSSGTGTKPTPLSKREVEKILAVKEETTKKPEYRLEWEEGDVVRIVSGPFNDFTGTIAEINVEQSKLRVMVNIFDRETPVELAFDQVAKA